MQCDAVSCNVLRHEISRSSQIVGSQDAVCCSALQCVAVCCSVLQCAAVCCSVLQRVTACCSASKYARVSLTMCTILIPTHCNTLKHIATHCKTVWTNSARPNRVELLLHNRKSCRAAPAQSLRYYSATHCITLHHTATHCTTLQHTAPLLQQTSTHRNILQHTTAHCNTLPHTATRCNTL